MELKDDTLPDCAWIWLPITALAVELGFRMANEPLYRKWWESELGPVETGTVAVLLLGIIAGLTALRQASKLPARWLSIWLVLAIFGCFWLFLAIFDCEFSKIMEYV